MVALCVLRFAIGIHFFSEGTSKYHSGKFTAEPFIRQARGPIAPYLQSMLDDENAMRRLCIDVKISEYPQRSASESGSGEIVSEQVVQLDPYLTKSIWSNFVLEANKVYVFGDPELIKELTSQKNQLGKEKADLMAKMRIAESADDGAGDVASVYADLKTVEEKISEIDQKIALLKSQVGRAETTLASSQRQLQSFLDSNEHEIIAYFGDLKRLDGFETDGGNREQVVEFVPSLRGQYAEIRGDIDKKRAQWTREVESIWDGLESDINELAIEEQQSRGPVELVRPYSPKTSTIQFINKFIPWFDMVVGGLLIVGLFSRLASFAGGMFLLTVILTQPFWLPGSAPTFYQSIELAGLFVIFATCAGRYGGLDGIVSGFGLMRRNQRQAA